MMARRAAWALAVLAAVAAVGAPGPRAAEPVKLRTLPDLYEDAKGTGLRAPESVAFDGKDRLAVADTGNGRIVLFTVTGDTITPGAEIRVAEITYPLQARFTSDGGLLVLDGKTKKIVRLSASGAFKGTVALQDDMAKGGMVPRSIRVGPGDALYVLDVAQGRVVVLGPDDRVRRRIEFPKDCRGLSDLAVDAKGVVYALESVGRRVLVARPDAAAFAPVTSLDEETAFPTSLAIDAQGRIVVVDQSGGGIITLGPDGSFRGRQSGMGWKEGLLRSPSGVAAGPPGMLFVADRGNNRVAVFGMSE